MRQRRIPILGLSLVMMLVLATLGTAYTLWSETLLINGTVYTGALEGRWVQCECMDNGQDPNPYPEPLKDKDVGATRCFIDEKDPALLHIIVDNGYPSYWNDCQVHFANVGSIPVKITGYRLIPKNFTPASGYGKDDGELWVKFWDGIGTQMEPCPDDSCEQASSIQFHVEQPAQEKTTYEFDMLICLRQWNEYATLDQCLAAAPR
jgi:hypothetical protein